MKTLIFDKNSWHYYFATKGSDFDPCDGHNICEYIQYVLAGIIRHTFVLLLLFALSYCAIHMILGIGFSIVYTTWLIDGAGFAGALLTFYLLAIIGVVYTKEYIHDRKWKRYEMMEKGSIERPDSFLVNAYKAWKNKYCVKIEFKDKS